MHRDGGLGVEIVSVLVETVIEGPDGEDAKVEIEHGDIHQVPQVAENSGPEQEQPEEANHERHPDKLGEVALQQRPHADVVVQGVDFAEVVPLPGALALQMIHVDGQAQRIGVLVRLK